jgi:dinuclear metal center YbgI/SA1388 family protein
LPVTTVALIAELLEELAPPQWAESWDNVGLLIGHPDRSADRILVALELTDAVVDEAIALKTELVVLHHPPIFGSLKALRFDRAGPRRMERLIQAKIGVYAAHTNYDQSQGGTNDTLAAAAGLDRHEVLFRTGDLDKGGAMRGHGRIGQLDQPVSLGQLCGQIKERLSIQSLRLVGDPTRPVTTVAVAAGSGKSFIATAAERGADVLVTGDVGHHDALDAEDAGLAVIDVGHYNSEVIAMAPLAEYLKGRLADSGHSSKVFVATAGRDPFGTI